MTRLRGSRSGAELPDGYLTMAEDRSGVEPKAAYNRTRRLRNDKYEKNTGDDRESTT